MSADLLERATRALADTTRERGADAARLERTLQRIQQARRPAPRSRQHWRTLSWTVAALFVGAGAWANVTGRVHWFREAPEPAEKVTASTPAERAPAPPSRAVAPKPAPVEPEPVEPAEQEAVEPERSSQPEPPASPESSAPRVRERRPRAPATMAPLPAPELPSAPAPSADKAYRQAHHAHFKVENYAAALSAWDRYLELAQPGHQLLPEARFNRAIALYRLGQWEAARRALAPFAAGAYGGYRRDDARRLIESLDTRR